MSSKIKIREDSIKFNKEETNVFIVSESLLFEIEGEYDIIQNKPNYPFILVTINGSKTTINSQDKILFTIKKVSDKARIFKKIKS